MQNDNIKVTDSEKPGLLVGCYGFWVILTYVNAVAGLTGMYFALNGNIRFAFICLMFAGLCDGLDGRVASLKVRTDREKSYGIQIDAFSDIISFGIFPPVLGYALIKHESEIFVISYLVLSVLFILAALIRLAYFNVIETEHLNRRERRTYFEGLPVTSVSIFLPMVYSLCCVLNLPLSYLYTLALIIIAVLFVARIKLPKPRGRFLVFLCLAALPAALYIIIFGGNQL